MDNFSARSVEYHNLPLPTGVKILHPERVALVFKKSLSIDFGALCYLHRSSQMRGRGQGRKVNISSFSQPRAHQIRDLIEYTMERFERSGLKPCTLFRQISNFVRFLDWCDSNQHGSALTNAIYARAAFRAFVVDMRRLVSQNQIGNNTAVRYQINAQSILQDYLNVESLDQGINLLVYSTRLTEPTAVPDDTSQEKVIAWCKCLFEGFSELVVDQKCYPFPLAVPGYLKWPDNRLWVFPVRSAWCRPPDQQDKKSCRVFDYHNGTVRTYEEILSLYGKVTKYPCESTANIARSQKYIERSNQDFFSYDRIGRGMLAVKAFLMMFIAATGNNPTQAVETPWSEELEDSIRNPLVERQGFRSIKYRANNRLVYFEISVEYMPHLRRYLQLRNYLLRGKRCKYLFFHYGTKLSGLDTDPIPLLAIACYGVFNTLRRLTPTLPRVLPRQWRAAKQDYVIRNHDPVTAALLMQHSPRTAIKKYSNGSEVAQQKELSAFLSQVEKIVLKKGQNIAGSEVRSIGICTSPKHPQAIVDHLYITPDCKGAEGCLFCDKYRVHADETDARKLFSARYCIRITSHLASSTEQFERLFGGVLRRIDFILNEVKRRNLKMMEKIEREVDVDGELDPLWSAKLETLIELELA